MMQSPLGLSSSTCMARPSRRRVVVYVLPCTTTAKLGSAVSGGTILALRSCARELAWDSSIKYDTRSTCVCESLVGRCTSSRCGFTSKYGVSRMGSMEAPGRKLPPVHATGSRNSSKLVDRLPTDDFVVEVDTNEAMLSSDGLALRCGIGLRKLGVRESELAGEEAADPALLLLPLPSSRCARLSGGADDDDVADAADRPEDDAECASLPLPLLLLLPVLLVPPLLLAFGMP